MQCQLSTSVTALPTITLSFLLLLLGSLLGAARAEEEEVGAAGITGIPDCANACALSFLQTQSCPLTSQSCVCSYLSYYASCTARTCNTTSALSAAVAPPVPFYLPSLTISIDNAASTGCAAVPAQNPVFGSKSSDTAKVTGVAASSSASASASAIGEKITIDTSLPPSTSRSTSRASSASLSTTSPSLSTSRSTSTSTSRSLSTQTERRTTSITTGTASANSTGSTVPPRITNIANAAERLGVGLGFGSQGQTGSMGALFLVFVVGIAGIGL